jgi:hypothetical protein
MSLAHQLLDIRKRQVLFPVSAFPYINHIRAALAIVRAAALTYLAAAYDFTVFEFDSDFYHMLHLP